MSWHSHPTPEELDWAVNIKHMVLPTYKLHGSFWRNSVLVFGHTVSVNMGVRIALKGSKPDALRIVFHVLLDGRRRIMIWDEKLTANTGLEPPQPTIPAHMLMVICEPRDVRSAVAPYLAAKALEWEQWAGKESVEKYTYYDPEQNIHYQKM